MPLRQDAASDTPVPTRAILERMHWRARAQDTARFLAFAMLVSLPFNALTGDLHSSEAAAFAGLGAFAQSVAWVLRRSERGTANREQRRVEG